MKNYHRIEKVFYAQPWAIVPAKLYEIAHFLRIKASGDDIKQAELTLIQEQARILESRREAAAQATARSGGMVAVLPVYGTISHRASLMTEMSGGTSLQKLTGQFRQAANDPQVKAIVLEFDSPGGSVDGVEELANEIFQARGSKKIVAVANTWADSAAYYLASAAEEIVVTPSGEVGSIGVWMMHADFSKQLESDGIKVTLVSAGKYKTAGNPYEPLSDYALAALQSEVNVFYEMFVKAVARARGVSAAEVRGGFGEGRAVTATEAVKLGIADRVATLDQTLERLGVSRGILKSGRAEEPAREIEPEKPEWNARLEMRRRQLRQHGH